MTCASCLEYWHHSEYYCRRQMTSASSVAEFFASRGGGFHLWDFVLGVLFSTAVMGLLYYRLRNSGLKALNRERQSFAVRVCCLSFMIGLGHDMLVRCAWMLTSKSAMQALKDMDSNTLKKVLGQVSTACLTFTGDTATLHASALSAWCRHVLPACTHPICLFWHPD